MVGHHSSKGKKTTESISFRLDHDLLQLLRELSKKRKVTLNSLILQILDDYLKVGVYDREFGFFSVSKELLRPALEKLTEDEIQKITADLGAKTHRQIIMYLFGKLNKETVVSYLDIFGNRFETYRHFDERGLHTLTFSHGISLQFSKIFYNVTKSILSLAEIEPIERGEEKTDYSFSISFALPS
jgi:hypothetical protein